MFEHSAVLTFYAETPLHPGTGSAVGAIDLPIQRERHTHLPLIPGSSIKGVLRDEAAQWAGEIPRRKALVTLIFGSAARGAEAGESVTDHAGALAFTDARLLLFPVRSLHGVFAWITCRLVLDRYRRDLAAAGETADWAVPDNPEGGRVRVTSQAGVTGPGGRVTLEEYTFGGDREGGLDGVAEHLAQHVLPMTSEYAPFSERLKRNMVLLPDQEFQDFAEFATEVVARIRIDQNTGTVAGGALWYEEQLPSETVLYGLALASKPRGQRLADNGDGLKCATALDVCDALVNRIPLDRVRIGGDETTGRGIVKLRVRRVVSGGEA